MIVFIFISNVAIIVLLAKLFKQHISDTMKFIQLTRNDAFLLLPGKPKMASKIDIKVDSCRK